MFGQLLLQVVAHQTQNVLKFTVLLLYPDYLAETFGHETYMTSVTADNVTQAKKLAQEEVAAENKVENPDDFFVLCVIAGEHDDIKDRE